jgi:hypothetical protein
LLYLKVYQDVLSGGILYPCLERHVLIEVLEYDISYPV